MLPSLQPVKQEEVIKAPVNPVKTEAVKMEFGSRSSPVTREYLQLDSEN